MSNHQPSSTAAEHSRVRGPVGRSREHTIAALLNLFVAVFSVVLSLPILQDGAATTNASSDQPPFVVIVVSFVLGILGVVSSYGVWQGQRWGVVLTIVVNAVSFLSGVPGVIFGPTAFLVISSVFGCALNIAIIYLLLKRTRPAAAEV